MRKKLETIEVDSTQGGIPIVRSLGFLSNSPLLTVELRQKWYSLVLVYSDETHEHISFPLVDEVPGFRGRAFSDHVPNPEFLRRYCALNNYLFDPLAEELITGRWVEEAFCPELLDPKTGERSNEQPR